MKIKISDEFTNAPGGRKREDGSYSGEEFRDTILIERFKSALEKKEKLEIDFDGGYGYATSFLEEAFGGLVRSGYDSEKIINTIEIISLEEPSLVERVKKYIIEAGNN